MSILTSLFGGSVVSKIASWVGDYFLEKRQTKKAETEMKIKLAEAKTQAQIDL